MHNGVFAGKEAKNQTKRVLILGESHHWDPEDWELQLGETEEQAEGRRKKKADAYKTEDVVKHYFANYAERDGKEKAYRFFDNIVQSFGVAPEKRTDFWNRVWFGNYIDELCGVRDSKATHLLKKVGKREELNKQLFEFIEENEIDIVFCFSRKVYGKLPPLEESLGDNEIKGDKSDSHRLDKCVYGAGGRAAVSVPLSKSVTVYGLKHPSQGFSYRKYQCSLKKLFQL